MSTARRTTARVALAAALALTAQAHAQQNPGAPVQAPRDEAREFFERSLTLLEEQRFAEAIPLLERSVALRENPAALAALAASHRGAGHYLRAIATLERLLAVNADPAREREARAVLRQCQGALARVTLRVEGASEVLLDGEPVVRSAGELRLDPGLHVFEARRAGHEPAREERRLDPGAVATVTLDASAHPLPATLVVEAEADVMIRVDGQPAGRGRVSSAVTPGRHAVQGRWSDGREQERVVDLDPGSRVVVSLAARREGAITSRWWFWTGAGVVAVGLVVAGVFIFSGTEDPVVGGWGHVPSAVVTP